jgi:hypothetical protein
MIDEPVRRYLEHAMPGGAGDGSGVRLEMAGRIRAGAWLPFTAAQECDGRSFCWHARAAHGLLRVDDRFAAGEGSTEIRLVGKVRVMRADGPDVARSAAGRAALESVFCPASLLPERGVRWRAESDDVIVATLDVPPERPVLRLRIDERGALRSVWALRWKDHDYIPCGCEVVAERRFGDLVVPSRVRVGWWFGTPRYAPFFEAEITALSAGRRARQPQTSSSSVRISMPPSRLRATGQARAWKPCTRSTSCRRSSGTGSR